MAINDKPQTDKSQRALGKPSAPVAAQAPKAQAADFRHLVRIANTDLDGTKPVYDALRKIKGVSFMYANAICHLTRIPRAKKTAELTEAEIGRIEEIFASPDRYSVPVWMRNRRRDYETGANMHLIISDLTYAIDNDIKRMKKIKSYKGVRHMIGQPVRGQRTKSNFRKNKGKVSLGVIRKKTQAGAEGGDKK